MKLLPLPQAPTRQQARFFRTSLSAPAFFLFILTGVLGVMLYSIANGGMYFCLILPFALLVLLFVFLFAQNLYKAIINTNWLLAIASDRIWIKYRSYLNCHLPADDLQIIEFPFSEIESVCLVDRKEIVPNNRNAKQQQLFWFFEFTLYQPIDERLPNALRSERQLKDSQNRIIRSKNDDYPVRVSGDYSFRVRVNELRPRWKKALRELEHNGVTIAPEKREIEDYTVLLEDKRQMEDQPRRVGRAHQHFE